MGEISVLLNSAKALGIPDATEVCAIGVKRADVSACYDAATGAFRNSGCVIASPSNHVGLVHHRFHRRLWV